MSNDNPCKTIPSTCNTDYNQDGRLDILDVQIYLQYVTTNSLLGRESRKSEVQERIDAIVLENEYATNTISNLPSFECSNFNSSFIAGREGNDVDGYLRIQDVQIYLQYSTLVSILGRIPTIEEVQDRVDDVVLENEYAETTINQLPTLGVSGPDKFVVNHTAEVTCDNPNSSNYGETFFVTAEGQSAFSFDDAQTNAIELAEFLAIHKLYEDCGCDDGSVFTSSYEILDVSCSCGCSASLGTEIDIVVTASSKFSVCDARLKAISDAEYQLALAQYQECRDDDNNCRGYFATHYASHSCFYIDPSEGSGSRLDWIVRRGSGFSCVSEDAAREIAIERAEYFISETLDCSIGLGEIAVCDATCSYIAYTSSVVDCPNNELVYGAMGSGYSSASAEDAFSNAQSEESYIRSLRLLGECNTTTGSFTSAAPFLCEGVDVTLELSASAEVTVSPALPYSQNVTYANLLAQNEAIIDLINRVTLPYVEGGLGCDVSSFYYASASVFEYGDTIPSSSNDVYQNRKRNAAYITAYGWDTTSLSSAQNKATNLANQLAAAFIDDRTEDADVEYSGSISSDLRLTAVGGSGSYGVDIEAINSNSTFAYSLEYRVYDLNTNEILWSDYVTINRNTSTILPEFLRFDFDNPTTHTIEVTSIKNQDTGEISSVSFKTVFRPIDYTGVTSSPSTSCPTHCSTKVLFIPNECCNIDLYRDPDLGYITDCSQC